MATTTISVETQHEDMIHDAQMDYYGKRLATASSDRTIRVFEVTDEQQRLLATLKGHDGPVWQVAWAHPKFGSLLASCSYDGKVCVWKEEQQNDWKKVWEYTEHEASVNSVSWAPHTLGLMLAAASADGTVSVHTYQETNPSWSSVRFVAHLGGVNAVSWAPEAHKGSLLSNAPNANIHTKRFVTGGCDNRIRIWAFDESQGKWVDQPVLPEHKDTDHPHHQDWVRDVQWAPSLGLPSNTIASCSEDRKVIIWTEDQHGQWTQSEVIQFDHKVWRVSWSIMGNILAVAQGDNKVSLWKETVSGKWTCLSTAQDEKEFKSQ